MTALDTVEHNIYYMTLGDEVDEGRSPHEAHVENEEAKALTTYRVPPLTKSLRKKSS